MLAEVGTTGTLLNSGMEGHRAESLAATSTDNDVTYDVTYVYDDVTQSATSTAGLVSYTGLRHAVLLRVFVHCA